MIIPKMEYKDRISNVQRELKREAIDILLTYGCQCEAANIRYFSNFWPSFDFAGVLIPQVGRPILLTGGPESYDSAKEISMIDDVRVHPLYVETSAPEWERSTDYVNFKQLLVEILKTKKVKRIGVANSNIIPEKIIQDLRSGAEGVEIVDADYIPKRVRLIKSKREIDLLRKAYKITEDTVKEAIEFIKPGLTEREVEQYWRKLIYERGAEDTSYATWVSCGNRTTQALCRSSDQKIKKDDFVQLTFGAKYEGYCGNMCRPVLVGNAPPQAEKLAKVALEVMNDVIKSMRPRIKAATIYNRFRDHLVKEGYESFILYGPAHGTGMQECEGPWLDNRSDLVLQPGMVFNVDIWINNDNYGVRFEDGVVVTEEGLEELGKYRREIIRK